VQRCSRRRSFPLCSRPGGRIPPGSQSCEGPSQGPPWKCLHFETGSPASCHPTSSRQPRMAPCCRWSLHLAVRLRPQADERPAPRDPVAGLRSHRRIDVRAAEMDPRPCARGRLRLSQVPRRSGNRAPRTTTDPDGLKRTRSSSAPSPNSSEIAVSGVTAGARQNGARPNGRGWNLCCVKQLRYSHAVNTDVWRDRVPRRGGHAPVRDREASWPLGNGRDSPADASEGRDRATQPRARAAGARADHAVRGGDGGPEAGLVGSAGDAEGAGARDAAHYHQRTDRVAGASGEPAAHRHRRKRHREPALA